ncbi:MAG: ATP-binding protein [Cyclobacteriaceae bacterium]|nr:ATP-binding protein [Cyclobacteriaceae bacterium]
MKNILLVEHDYVDVEIFKRSFKEEYVIFSADTYDEAIDLLKNEVIHAIIVEEMMQGFSGIDLLKTVYKEYPDIPRIFLTAMDYSEVMQKAINEANVSFYLKKPFRSEEMKVVLDSAIDLYHLRQVNKELEKELKNKNRILSRRVLEQSVNLDHQEQLLGKYHLVEQVASSQHVKLGDWDSAIPQIASIVVSEVKASSASVWILSDDKSEMVNFGSYDITNHEEKKIETIYSCDFPNYFETILKGINIRKERLGKDLLCEEIIKQFPSDCNLKAILDIPFFIEEDVVGVLRVANYDKTRKWIASDLMMLLTLSEQLSNLYINHKKKILESELLETNNSLITYQEELHTQLEKLEKTQSKLVVSEKMAAIGMLLAGIAHEINNPVNFVCGGAKAIRSNFEYLQDICSKFESKGKEEANELLDEISELLTNVELGAERIITIVKELKNYSRADDELMFFNIHEGLDTSLTLLGNKINDNIQIVKNYEKKLVGVYCFPGQINQVFMNVINNAVQAVKENGIINIITKSVEDDVEIIIKDNGVGIDDEGLSKIFNPLYTTKSKDEGNGMGLYISKEIINKHQGKLEVNSVLGEGTEVKISIAKNMNTNG